MGEMVMVTGVLILGTGVLVLGTDVQGQETKGKDSGD